MQFGKSVESYDAKLKENIRIKVNDLVNALPYIYFEESLSDRLCRAAIEFAAGKRETIDAEVGPLHRNPGPVLFVRLEFDDFDVVDTESQDDESYAEISKQQLMDIAKPGEAV